LPPLPFVTGGCSSGGGAVWEGAVGAGDAAPAGGLGGARHGGMESSPVSSLVKMCG